jgi:hypothetical protein
MVVVPNKPVLFSVDHRPEAVQPEIGNFKKTISGKKFLFIELSPVEIDEIIVHGKYSSDPSIRSYQTLVSEAHQAGLKVIALDETKARAELAKLLNSLEGLPLFLAGLKRQREIFYKMYSRREKLWCEKLKGARSDAVAVMHPGHADSISRQLKIPAQNIVGSLNKAYEARRLAEEKASRIEKGRLERAKNRAKSRAGKNPFRK